MKVDVVDGLVGNGSIVLQNVVVLIARCGNNNAEGLADLAHDVSGQLVGAHGVVLGDDERVAAAEGVNVHKGQDCFVFKHFEGRNGSGHNLAKDAAAVDSVLHSRPLEY